jgi:hypothetical protein
VSEPNADLADPDLIDTEPYFMEFGQQKQFSVWAKLTEMITGPDYEYVYLRRIISRMKEYYRRHDVLMQR